jgi:hypothetical protein
MQVVVTAPTVSNRKLPIDWFLRQAAQKLASGREFVEAE